MVKYDSKVIRLSKETIEKLEEIRLKLPHGYNDSVTYLIRNANYDRLISMLCEDFLTHFDSLTKS